MRLFAKTRSMLKQESGVALMMAIASVTMLMIIATEVMYETGVELVVSSQSVNQLKAHYAAKAGIELSLLRIHIYKKASAMAGDQIPSSVLDPIWQMPFAWPPIVPEDTSGVEKSEIADSVKSSKMSGTYFTTIESEGGKIDVNDLASPSKVVADATRLQLLQIYTSKMEGDEEFAERNRNSDFGKVIDNITDWIDENKTQAGGSGDEASLYPDRGNSDLIPPNSPFKTLDELHMVEGVTDEVFEMIAPRLTVFGVKGVNVNYASKEVLMSLSPQITEERVKLLMEARSKPDRGPFKDEADFVNYLNSIGVNGDPFKNEDGSVKVPLLFGAEFNFRVRSTGRAGRVQREITAIVYDFDRVKARLKGLMPVAAPANEIPDDQLTDVERQKRADDKKKADEAAKNKKDTPAKVPAERPNIVYWNET